jgi:putative ABC transport system permease protein
VSTDYFKTMGIPLLRGRDFDEHDGPGAPGVVIVDERIAARFWPGRSALGRRLKLGSHASEAPWLEVVGVVGHVKFEGVQHDARWQLYLPEAAHPSLRYTLVAKAAGDPMALAEPIRRAVLGLDPEQPLASVRTMEDYVGTTTRQGRLLAGLLSLFAAAALLLAGLGLYGVISGMVTERTREIAVRLALGARGAQVVRMLVRRGLGLVVVGTAVGLAASAIVARLAGSLLYGVSPADPATHAAVIAFLLAVAMVAHILPAVRVTRVDPVQSLRAE